MSARRALHAPGFRSPKGLPGLMEYSDLVVTAALSEDIGPGDITTSSVVGPDEKGVAEIIAKEDLVLAGLFVAKQAFKAIDKRVVFKTNFRDGDAAAKGVVIATVTGSLCALLTAERVALNFLQRMSGTATLTRMFVERVEGAGARILDTRKTTPCLRMLEKYSVMAGGGVNHRFGLFDQVLIKDNHIKAAGGIGNAVEKARAACKRGVLVEVEVTDIFDVREALSTDVDIIMLDNMSVTEIRKAVGEIGDRAYVEVSGGVDLRSVRKLAETGVDFISVGALTHSARSVDISMKVVS